MPICPIEPYLNKKSDMTIPFPSSDEYPESARPLLFFKILKSKKATNWTIWGPNSSDWQKAYHL
jgi:hypothetical protein